MSEGDERAGAPTGEDLERRTRTHLASWRTFLAWFRTGIARIVLGIGAGPFLATDRGLTP